MKKLLFLLIPALILGLTACQVDSLNPEERSRIRPADFLATSKIKKFPLTIPLPDDFRPIGITNGRGSEFYVASTLNDAIYKGDFRTGTGQIFIPATAPIVPGPNTIGIAFDKRSGLLYACLSQSGRMKVYDTQTGSLVMNLLLASDPPISQQAPSFVNDVVVGKSAVYFSDSFRPVLYKIKLGPGGQLPNKPSVQTLPFPGIL